jgi:hypothetical protein
MLAGMGTEGEGDVTPGVEAGCRRRQMQDDAAHRDDHVDAQLEQSFAQPVSPVTWVRAYAVRTARSRSPCIST